MNNKASLEIMPKVNSLFKNSIAFCLIFQYEITFCSPSSAKICCWCLPVNGLHGFSTKATCFRVFSSLFCEASPHKRRLKYITNISPKRLMTHLLHQIVHYRTTLRGSEQRNATIARTTTHTHTTKLNIKRRSSESCAMRYPLRVTLIHRQGWVQDGTPTQHRQVQSLDLLL